MQKSFSMFASGLLLAQPLLAATPSSKSEQDRQLHEIVFQNYPPRALAAGQEGPVFFTVTLDKDAHPVTCQVTHGSGYPDLDEETCNLIVQHAVFSSAKDANGHVVKQTTDGVVNWTLPGHAPAPINLTAAAAAPKVEPQVCKKTLRAGTLSSYERTCMTPSQWAKQSDQVKQTYNDMQGMKGNSVCSTSGSSSGMDGGISAAPAPGC